MCKIVTLLCHYFSYKTNMYYNKNWITSSSSVCETGLCITNVARKQSHTPLHWSSIVSVSFKFPILGHIKNFAHGLIILPLWNDQISIVRTHSTEINLKAKNINARSQTRADSRLAPSQWETSLQSNVVSHWLGANLESAQQTLVRWFLSQLATTPQS